MIIIQENQRGNNQMGLLDIINTPSKRYKWKIMCQFMNIKPISLIQEKPLPYDLAEKYYEEFIFEAMILTYSWLQNDTSPFSQLIEVIADCLPLSLLALQHKVYCPTWEWHLLEYNREIKPLPENINEIDIAVVGIGKKIKYELSVYSTEKFKRYLNAFHLEYPMGDNYEDINDLR